MPKLYYAGHTFELAPNESGTEDNLATRIDDALIAGRELVAHTKVPTNMILAVTQLANGHDLVFGFNGSLPIAIESDTTTKP